MTALTDIEAEALKAFARPAVLNLAKFPAGLHFVRGRNLTNTRLGSNGSGKSSFFSDAVTWCLYGRTVGGLRTTDVQSWLTKSPPRAAVTVEHNGKEYTIARGPKASALTINDKLVGQDEVDALLELDYAAWCQAIIWGQGEPLFFDLAPAAKMGLLSDALGLERWERRAQAAATRARQLGERLLQLEGEVQGLGTAHKHAQEASDTARAAAEEWGATNAARIEEAKKLLSTAREHTDSIEEKRSQASLAADEVGTRAKLIAPIVKEQRAALVTLRQEHRDLEHAQNTNVRELEEVQKQLVAFRDEGTCPTCGQAVTKANAKTHIRELSQRAKDLHSACEDTARDMVAKAKKVSQATAELQQNDAELQQLEEAEVKLTGELRLFDRELGAAQTAAGAAEKALAAAVDAENPHRQARAEARARLQEIKADLEAKTELATKFAASVERAQFWTRGFREIRLGIIDDVLDDLRETTAEVLDGLGLGDWEVEYSSERETKKGTARPELTVVLKSPAAPSGVRWEAYSGGERQRLRLAGALALSEVLLAHAGAALDFRVLDEPTRGLSREGVRDLVEVLGDYAERAGLKIFYVDHTSEEGLAFTSTITVVSDANGAHIQK